jgi:hypothetical protein
VSLISSTYLISKGKARGFFWKGTEKNLTPWVKRCKINEVVKLRTPSGKLCLDKSHLSKAILSGAV